MSKLIKLTKGKFAIVDLGSSKSKITVANLYNQAAIQYFGEFSRLNILENGGET